MSISAIILMNLFAAAILVAILATLMLVPARLHRPFAAGHTPRQKLALRKLLHARGSQQPWPQRSSQRGLRPIPD
ncbi:MAG: hypothetical protein H0X42_01650 [Solirubrobacterales bacterium]|nr:hypothetical protein [Solirubrobacterales bacterium]